MARSGSSGFATRCCGGLTGRASSCGSNFSGMATSGGRQAGHRVIPVFGEMIQLDRAIHRPIRPAMKSGIRQPQPPACSSGVTDVNHLPRMVAPHFSQRTSVKPRSQCGQIIPTPDEKPTSDQVCGVLIFQSDRPQVSQGPSESKPWKWSHLGHCMAETWTSQF